MGEQWQGETDFGREVSVEKQLRNCRGCRAGADSPRTKERGFVEERRRVSDERRGFAEERRRVLDERRWFKGERRRSRRRTKEKSETNEGEVGDERKRSRRRMETSSTWRNEKDQQTAEYICRTLRIRPRGCYRQIPNDSEMKSLPLLTGDEDK